MNILKKIVRFYQEYYCSWDKGGWNDIAPWKLIFDYYHKAIYSMPKGHILSEITISKIMYDEFIKDSPYYLKTDGTLLGTRTKLMFDENIDTYTYIT